MDVPKTQSTQASAADRRRQRRAVEMRGLIIRSGGISHGIEVTDLNYGGCGIDTPVELTPGETVKLSVLGRGCIPAEVRWYREGKAGLDFEPAERASRKKVDRRTARIDVPGEVGLRSVGRNGYRVRVFDLSTDGCKIELVERPNVGDQMLVKFDGIEVLNADVCWVEGPTAGLMFENRLHPAVLDLLLQRLGAG